MIQAVLDWVPIVVGATTFFSIVVFAPLGIFRAIRAFAGFALVFASYIFALVLWFYGAVATFTYWGWAGLIIGLVVFGVGVVPMGFVALALQARWEWVGQLAVLLVPVSVSRLLGLWLMESPKRRLNLMNGPNDDDAPQYEFSADEERQQRADRAAMLSKAPKPYSMLTKQRGPGFPSGAPKPYSWLGGVGKDIAAKD